MRGFKLLRGADIEELLQSADNALDALNRKIATRSNVVDPGLVRRVTELESKMEAICKHLNVGLGKPNDYVVTEKKKKTPTTFTPAIEV